MVDPQKLGLSPERLARIRPAIEKHVADDKLAGALTLLARRGQLVHTECVGLMDREGEVPMRPDAIFRFYSMTKPLICVALMTLYEQGHFQLADPVSKFIPAFETLKVYAGGQLVGLEQEVTVRHLLTHTSGLSYHFWEYSPVEQMYREARVCSTQPLAEFVADLLKLPLAFPPGTAYRYGFSHDVIAHLIELISDRPVDEYLQENLLGPLGMVDTGYYVPKEKLTRLTAMYGTGDIMEPDMSGTKWEEGAEDGNKLIFSAADSPESRPHNAFRGGHGLAGTAADYLRFCQMMLNGGELDDSRILGRKTVELMTTNHLAPELLPYEEGGLYKPGFGYGLGFGVLMDIGQSQIIGSEGEYAWSGAATTSFWIDPKEELIGIQLTQFQPMGFHLIAEDFKVAAYQAII